jgi:hypothetical protein
MSKIKQQMMAMCEEPMMDPCVECLGDGVVEVDVPRPQSFSRDIGYMDSETIECEHCAGVGKVDRLCVECGEEIYKAYVNRTHIGGEDRMVLNPATQTLCEECINENV